MVFAATRLDHAPDCEERSAEAEQHEQIARGEPVLAFTDE
jgi:hypothetical protein